MEDNRSQYWKNNNVTTKSEGRVWQRSNGEYACNECCNGDRCDDPRHRDRSSCPACLGTGSNLTSDKLNNQWELKQSNS